MDSASSSSSSSSSSTSSSTTTTTTSPTITTTTIPSLNLATGASSSANSQLRVVKQPGVKKEVGVAPVLYNSPMPTQRRDGRLLFSLPNTLTQKELDTSEKTADMADMPLLTPKTSSMDTDLPPETSHNHHQRGGSLSAGSSPENGVRSFDMNGLGPSDADQAGGLDELAKQSVSSPHIISVSMDKLSSLALDNVWPDSHCCQCDAYLAGESDRYPMAGQLYCATHYTEMFCNCAGCGQSIGLDVPCIALPLDDHGADGEADDDEGMLDGDFDGEEAGASDFPVQTKKRQMSAIDEDEEEEENENAQDKPAHPDDDHNKNNNNSSSAKDSNSSNHDDRPARPQTAPARKRVHLRELLFHPGRGCFSCTACRKSFEEGGALAGQECVPHHGKVYCMAHYLETFGTSCTYCSKKIEKADALFALGQPFCSEHLYCAGSCGRPLADAGALTDNTLQFYSIDATSEEYVLWMEEYRNSRENDTLNYNTGVRPEVQFWQKMGKKRQSDESERKRKVSDIDLRGGDEGEGEKEEGRVPVCGACWEDLLTRQVRCQCVVCGQAIKQGTGVRVKTGKRESAAETIKEQDEDDEDDDDDDDELRQKEEEEQEEDKEENENVFESTERWCHKACCRCSVAHCPVNYAGDKGSTQKGKIVLEGESLFCVAHLLLSDSVPCGGCEKPVRTDQEGSAVRINNVPFHPDCVRCVVCDTKLEGSELVEVGAGTKAETKGSSPSKLKGEFEVPDIYCRTHWMEYHAPRCVECLRVVPLHGHSGVSIGGSPYHRACLTCKVCQTTLTQWGVCRAPAHAPLSQRGLYCEEHFKAFFTHTDPTRLSRSISLTQGQQVSCPMCGEEVRGGKALLIGTDLYHKQCFFCKRCNGSFPDSLFVRHPLTKKLYHRHHLYGKGPLSQAQSIKVSQEAAVYRQLSESRQDGSLTVRTRGTTLAVPVPPPSPRASVGPRRHQRNFTMA
eukprot:g38012.t1